MECTDETYLMDTHAHLDGEEFAEDIAEVIERAKAAGVHKILIPNINGNTTEGVKSLCKQYAGMLHPMIGLHPEDVSCDSMQVLDTMETELQQPNDFIAIGEIGLDYYWDASQKELQKYVFRRQALWSNRYSLPLMIHTRSAHSDMVEIMTDLKEHGEIQHGGVFHCFAGTAEEAKDLLAFDGFMLGIGGIVTFKKSTLPDVLREVVPLSRIVVETDSPYMAPVPNRGKRNESAYVADVARKLAEIYNCTPEEVAIQTTRNAAMVFGAKCLE